MKYYTIKFFEVLLEEIDEFFKEFVKPFLVVLNSPTESKLVRR